MADDQWWEDESEEEVNTKEKVENMLNEAEIKRLQREEEVAQAEHEAKIAELERTEADARSGVPDEALGEPLTREQAWMRDGFDSIEDWMLYEATKDGELTEEEQQEFVERAHGGAFGLWWLSAGEALSIGLAAIFCVFAFGMGILVTGDSVTLDTTTGTVEPGTEWWEEPYEVEDCLYDEYDDVYYDCYYYYEYDCGSDVVYNYTIADVEYSGQDGLFLGTWDDHCLETVEFEELPLGSQVEVYYNVIDPSQSGLDDWSGVLGLNVFILCGAFSLLLLLVTLVNARYSNPTNVGGGGSDGDGVGHHHHHGGYGRWGWGSRVYIGGSRRFRTRGRMGGRSSERRRSAGGRRSSGGGGRRSGGGGGRRSGGGGGRRSGGGGRRGR
jgi:hypothetical protein